MLEKIGYPRSAAVPRMVVAALDGIYFLIFYALYDRIGFDVYALAVIPIAAAGW